MGVWPRVTARAKLGRAGGGSSRGRRRLRGGFRTGGGVPKGVFEGVRGEGEGERRVKGCEKGFRETFVERRASQKGFEEDGPFKASSPSSPPLASVCFTFCFFHSLFSHSLFFSLLVFTPCLSPLCLICVSLLFIFLHFLLILISSIF